MRKRNALIAFLVVIILALFTISLKFITPTPAHAEESDKHDVIFTLGKTAYTVDGREKELDVAPYTKNGRTYIPVRYLAQALGAKVQWDEASQTVWLFGDKKISLVVGSSVMALDDKKYQLDIEPEITNGRTMLPARWVAEALGYGVDWNETANAVHIRPARAGEALLQLQAPKPQPIYKGAPKPAEVVFLESAFGVEMKNLVGDGHGWDYKDKFLMVGYSGLGYYLNKTQKCKCIMIGIFPQRQADKSFHIVDAPPEVYPKFKKALEKFFPQQADEAYKCFMDNVADAKKNGSVWEPHKIVYRYGDPYKAPLLEIENWRNGGKQVVIYMYFN
ncbi:hypothetical protein DCCM_3275 [Desulfocucumis palustris]|uniref:Copper amine oxidase-like N-terminal domain-containing protein n=1 Tax=Desulfocucumis palustris TaxID=1898651 RepID=A0A2L2XEM6_9FIRM|nr:copper amine oxidase N-terminal domain-containing protein [Desulfocucumis palustris]GBF34163.1 hypothetical protein DCCM_3275 [Desulfocucumis palustris]